MQAFTAAGFSERLGVAQDYGRVLAALIDPERFPALSATVASGVFEDADDDWDVEVEFGLDRILDGIGVLIDARQRTERELPERYVYPRHRHGQCARKCRNPVGNCMVCTSAGPGRQCPRNGQGIGADQGVVRG